MSSCDPRGPVISQATSGAGAAARRWASCITDDCDGLLITCSVASWDAFGKLLGWRDDELLAA